MCTATKLSILSTRPHHHTRMATNPIRGQRLFRRKTSTHNGVGDYVDIGPRGFWIHDRHLQCSHLPIGSLLALPVSLKPGNVIWKEHWHNHHNGISSKGKEFCPVLAVHPVSIRMAGQENLIGTRMTRQPSPSSIFQPHGFMFYGSSGNKRDYNIQSLLLLMVH